MFSAIRFPPKYIDQANQFFEIYEGQTFAMCPESKLKGLKHHSSRVCRFCKKKAGEVTFKEDAHLFPMALGNRYLVSDFECDSCNKIFGRYEDDLTKFLGITRTIARTKGRKKTPGFETKGLKVSTQEFFGHPNVIKIASTSSTNAFSYDVNNNAHLITYTKPPYTPLNVLKSLIKMALCLVPEDEMKDYDHALKFLVSANLDKHLNSFPMFMHVLPNSYKDIFGMLFKKKEPHRNATTHFFVLFYSSFMFQIFIPFNSQDYKHYNDLAIPLFPPFFDGSGSDHWDHLGPSIVDLSSNEKKTDDISVMGVRPLVDVQSLVAIDPITGKIIPRKIDPSSIVGMYMVDENFKIDVEE